jgi:hypothetical protein
MPAGLLVGAIRPEGPRPWVSLHSAILSSQILHMPPILGSTIGVEIAVLRNIPL